VFFIKWTFDGLQKRGFSAENEFHKAASFSTLNLLLMQVVATQQVVIKRHLFKSTC